MISKKTAQTYRQPQLPVPLLHEQRLANTARRLPFKLRHSGLEEVLPNLRRSWRHSVIGKALCSPITILSEQTSYAMIENFWLLHGEKSGLDAWDAEMRLRAT